MANGIGIIVKKEDKEYLDTIKEYPRETYGDIINKLIECWKDKELTKNNKEILKKIIPPDVDEPKLPPVIDATTPTEPILDDPQNPENISTE